MSVSEAADTPAKRHKKDESTQLSDVAPCAGIKGNPGEIVNWEWQEKLRQLLLCPVCYETIRPPVEICRNGHSVCQKCKINLENCPLCSSAFMEIRNVMLAQIAEYIRYPCLNAKGGCPKMSYLREEKAHMRICEYKIHQCKIGNCEWTGPKKDLVIHVGTYHPGNILERDWYFSETVRLRPNNPFTGIYLLIVQGETFWNYLKYCPDKNKLYGNIQYVGTKEMAEKFSYQMCLKSTDGKTGYQFRSVMEDDSVNRINVSDSPTCATIDGSFLEHSDLHSVKRITFECHYTLHKS